MSVRLYVGCDLCPAVAQLQTDSVEYIGLGLSSITLDTTYPLPADWTIGKPYGTTKDVVLCPEHSKP